MWERFASPPIRNAGTMGGNVANGSPIGDSMPGADRARRARGAAQPRAVAHAAAGGPLRRLPEEGDGGGRDRRGGRGPAAAAALRFRTYKLSKRYDSDISAVCAAFALDLDGERIARCRVAFGGMAATPKRAPATEARAVGNGWTEATARAAMAALAADYAPLTDMRASAAYRLQTARNLLYRFYLETRPGDPLPAAAVSVFAAAC